MGLPENSRFQLTPDLSICRVLTGLWQVSGGHGRIDPDAAVRSMFDYADAGFHTWDLADHYGPAEEFIGEFRRQLSSTRGSDSLAQLQAFTKWVPPPGPMSREVVDQAVGKSLRRMDVERLDMMQFHWWDYGDNRYLEALDNLTGLKDEGRIRHVGLTNFDTDRLELITRHGVPVVSNQVQYSMIDRRPEQRMAAVCRDTGVHLLAYGTLCGGLLSDRYLGRPEPRRAELNTASLGKYKQMIDAWGGWELFQELLLAARGIAYKHSVSVANVAVRYVLDRPAVAGVIAGARLGVAEHREENARVFDFSLDDEDREGLESVLGRSRDLYRIIGDCGDEYRR